MSNGVELLNTSIGLGGSKVISDTARHSGKWKVIHILADTIFNEYTDSVMSGNFLGVTIKQGTTLGGDISVIKLTSGTIICYE